jgi:exopolyphosphatase
MGSEALNAFLREAAAEARGDAADRATLRAVLGNEASDLDSMASSVVYAYLLARGRAGGDPPCLPVINIPRADLGLRPEALWLLRESGVDERSLVFLDEIDLDAIHAAGRLRLVLVDHNRLSAAQEAWAPAVEEILDHHAEEGRYPAAGRVIEAVGSCATLVAERLLLLAPQLADAGVAALLLGTILLDTVNLDPAAGKGTPRDERAAARLLGLAGADGNALFDRLQAEKLSAGALGSRDILRRDYKEYRMGGTRCGISSALLPLADWAGRDPKIEASFRGYAEERGLDLLLAMSVRPYPELRRELAIYAKDASLRERVIAFLNRSGLGLAPLETGAPTSLGRLAFYSQADRGRSRKKLQPLLARLFQDDPARGLPDR